GDPFFLNIGITLEVLSKVGKIPISKRPVDQYGTVTRSGDVPQLRDVPRSRYGRPSIEGHRPSIRGRFYVMSFLAFLACDAKVGKVNFRFQAKLIKFRVD
ncbi:MAG: hypothetical protein AAFY76_27135, partial [Cyanobacteria bacterium J06649_11]